MDDTKTDPRDELEYQGRYREDAHAPDEYTTRAIAHGVAEIDRLRAEVAALRAPAGDAEVVDAGAIALLAGWEENTMEWAATQWAKWKANAAECQRHMDVYLELTRAVLAAIAPRIRAAALEEAAAICHRHATNIEHVNTHRGKVTLSALWAASLLDSCAASIRRLGDAP